MGILTGIAGAVDGINTVRAWSIATLADIQAIIASNTKAGPLRLAGNTDWNGNYTAYGHTPVKMPGEAMSFIGSIDGTNGAVGTAIIDSVDITINIETGEAISHVVNFSANGTLSLGAAAASDATTPDPPTSIGCKVKIAPAADGIYVELTDVRTVTITISRTNQSYVSSATAGQVKRVTGNLEASVAISVYNDDFNNLPVANDIKFLQIYVTATTFWLFEAMIFGDVSDLTVDRETAAIIGATLNGLFTGFFTYDGSPTEGKIVNPASVTYWPF